jgi:hypothetical protein
MVHSFNLLINIFLKVVYLQKCFNKNVPRSDLINHAFIFLNIKEIQQGVI